MRWGVRKQQQQAAQGEQRVREDERERGGKEKGSRGRAFSLSSPFSWLGKLTGKEKPGAGATKHAPTSAPPTKSGAGAAAPTAFPSCLPKRTSPSPAVVTPGRPCTPAADVVPLPRRLSVGNDSADAAVAARRHSRSRRHCSLGGDRELQPLGHLIPFSLTTGGFPSTVPPRTAVPSDTDAAAPPRTNVRRRRCRRRRLNRTRRLSISGGGIGSGRRSSSFSFSGRMVMPLRATTLPELERLAVVRRTRDPQRAFRESMVEMIASGGGRLPDEPERLLACYLSLNADEHHDCIVKVFRQVWFEYINLLPPRPDAAGGRRAALITDATKHSLLSEVSAE